MPDFTMCTNATCKLKNYCWRSAATQSELNQSFAEFEYNLENNNCEYFKPLPQ